MRLEMLTNRWHQRRLVIALIGLVFVGLFGHLGREWYVVHSRRKLLDVLAHIKGPHEIGTRRSISLLRQWCGDVEIQDVFMPESAAHGIDSESVLNLFPEATIWQLHPEPPPTVIREPVAEANPLGSF